MLSASVWGGWDTHPPSAGPISGMDTEHDMTCPVRKGCVCLEDSDEGNREGQTLCGYDKEGQVRGLVRG